MSKFATYEIEDELKRKGYRYIAGIDEAGRGCEHPSAEVLTRDGWKFYAALSVNDEVLSYSKGGEIVWQKVDKVIIKDFSGVLVELKNRSVTMLVTPDHCCDVLRRTFRRDKEKNDRLIMTGYVFNGRKIVTALLPNDFIPRGGIWIGEHKDCFFLPAVEKLKFDSSGKNYFEKTIPMTVWLAFLGIYLAEGNCAYSDAKNYRVIISQEKKSKDYYAIENLLKQLPFGFRKWAHGFICYNKQLSIYLKQLGDKYNKFIPTEIKNLTPQLLNILIDWLIIGGGSRYKGKNRKEVCTYYTVSHRLRDDSEEILLKAGWTYKTRKKIPKDVFLKGRLIKKENQAGCYEIRLRRNNKIHCKSLHKKVVPYDGEVFCLSLPEHHNFFVRRDGSGYFTGNSLSGPVVAGCVIIPEEYLSRFIGRVKDSKKLSDKRRRAMYELIRCFCKCGIGIVDNSIIDEINILQATKLAMIRAYENMGFKCDFVIVDGDFTVPGLDVLQQSIINGDNLSISIAAGSIIAKVTRDDIMEELHYVCPEYGFKNNKGYGTKEHIEAIKIYGSTRFHRQTFSKVGGE